MLFSISVHTSPDATARIGAGNDKRAHMHQGLIGADKINEGSNKTRDIVL